MKQNLDTLKTEILEFLEKGGFVVYFGEVRQLNQQVGWDTRLKPDFQDYLATATACGARMIVFYSEQFSGNQADEALEDLDVVDLPEEDYRGYDKRLNELREYDGFTCLLELSYSFEGCNYLFHLHTDWYAEFMNIRSDIDDAFPEESEEGDDSMGGYFSRN